MEYTLTFASASIEPAGAVGSERIGGIALAAVLILAVLGRRVLREEKKEIRMKKILAGLFLSLLILLSMVSGCGQGAGDGSAGAHDTDISGELVYEGSMELLYAENFTVDYYTGDFSWSQLTETRGIWWYRRGSEAPGDLDGDVTVLHQPLNEIYLVASACHGYVYLHGRTGHAEFYRNQS